MLLQKGTNGSLGLSLGDEPKKKSRSFPVGIACKASLRLYFLCEVTTWHVPGAACTSYLGV